MPKGRLEAFSDGVLAIIITIMVLELHDPDDGTWTSLAHVAPTFLAYVLSFIYLGIYWNNHHHMLQAARQVNGAALWANLHLLFWLSLIPFASNWMGKHFGPVPVAVYGAVLLMAAIAYTILATILVRHHGPDSTIARAIGSDTKGKISMLLYAAGIAIALFLPWVACAIFAGVALIWLIPDMRIERELSHHPAADHRE